MRTLLVGLTSLMLAGIGLGTDTCAAGATDVFTDQTCCPPTPARLRSRHFVYRTDECTGSCCDAKAPGPPVVSSGGSTDLQCGKKYGEGDPQDVDGGVTYTLEKCPTSDETCFHVKLSAVSAVSDIHLAILPAGGNVGGLPNGVGNWPQNGYCSYSGNEGNCWVPVSEVLKIVGLTSLCDAKDIIVAAGISISGATCFNRGSTIDAQGRWFMYHTVSFSCPDVCTHTCCCPPPPPPPPPTTHTCSIGTAFGYNKDSFKLLQALGGQGCKRWGWYYETDLAGGLSGDLIVGAGGNDVSKGTPVGTFSATRSGGSVVVNYSLNNGFEAAEVHILVSCTAPAKCAPGSYTYNNNALPATINVSCSKYYLIFHAKVNQVLPETTPCPKEVV